MIFPLVSLAPVRCCPPPVCAWVCRQAAVLCFLSGTRLGFKIPSLKGPSNSVDLLPSSRGPHCIMSCATSSQNSHMAAEVLGVYGKAQHRSNNQVLCHLQTPLSPDNEQMLSGGD